ncbi:hypothetical protein HispidOSU_012354, partial [Sigmodon hispidus]
MERNSGNHSHGTQCFLYARYQFHQLNNGNGALLMTLTEVSTEGASSWYPESTSFGSLQQISNKREEGP